MLSYFGYYYQVLFALFIQVLFFDEIVMEFLNGQFEREDIFFGEMVQLLSNFNWIYKSRNTDILADDILNCIPKSWIPIFQLNCLDNIQMAIKGETQVYKLLTSLQWHSQFLIKVKSKFRICSPLLVVMATGPF